MPKWRKIKGGMYIHIAEAIEVELRELDDIRVFPHVHDKLCLAEAKRWIALAVYDLINGDIKTAQFDMGIAFSPLEEMLGDGAREYFVDVMDEIDRKCKKI